MPSDERRPKYRYDDGDGDDGGDADYSDDQAQIPRHPRFEDKPSYKEAKPRARPRRDFDELGDPPSSRYQDPRDVEPSNDRKAHAKPKRRETYDDDDDDLMPRRKPTQKDMDALPRQRRGFDADDFEDPEDMPRRSKSKSKGAFPDLGDKRSKDFDEPAPQKNEGRRRAATFDDYAPSSRHKEGSGFGAFSRGRNDDDNDDYPSRRKDRGKGRNDRYDDKENDILPAAVAAGAGAGAMAAHRRRNLDDNDRGYHSDRDRNGDRERDRDHGYRSDRPGAAGGRSKTYDDEAGDRGYRSSRRDDPYSDRDRDRGKSHRSSKYYDDNYDDKHRGYASDKPSSRRQDSTRDRDRDRDRDRGYRSDRDKAKSRSSRYDSYDDRDRDRNRDKSRDKKKRASGLGGFNLDADSLGRYYETGQKHYKTFKPIIDSVAKMYLNNKK